jgi:hypothetical protein
LSRVCCFCFRRVESGLRPGLQASASSCPITRAMTKQVRTASHKPIVRTS